MIKLLRIDLIEFEVRKRQRFIRGILVIYRGKKDVTSSLWVIFRLGKLGVVMHFKSEKHTINKNKNRLYRQWWEKI